jgi:membrane protein involved in colicin uptake
MSSNKQMTSTEIQGTIEALLAVKKTQDEVEEKEQEAEGKQKAEEGQKRKAEEEWKKKAKEERKKKGEEERKKKAKEEEKVREAAWAKKRKAEEERKRVEEQKAAEDAAEATRKCFLAFDSCFDTKNPVGQEKGKNNAVLMDVDAKNCVSKRSTRSSGSSK